tara:strand:- start:8454 stop:10532 length:2079 start_codon:yes stop_codon:yes gene_type:complete
MQFIQLYIEGTRVDLFDDESVSLTNSIQQIKDISKVFTSFSQTFSIPASKINNKLFKHYYNFDIVNGFDGRLKVNGTIELNYLNFQKGKIKLEGVELKKNEVYAYKITFFGNTVELKDLIAEDTLDALVGGANWIDGFSKPYTSAAIYTGLRSGYDITNDGVTYNNAIITPLISHTTRLFYDSASNTADDGNLAPNGNGESAAMNHGIFWKDLKYAIRVDLVIKAIEKTYGLTFSTDFFNSTNAPYYNLYLWMHRKKGNVDDPNAPATFPQLLNFGLDTTMTNVIANGEIITVSNQTGNNKITSSLTINVNSAEDTVYTVNVIRDGVIQDSFSATAPSAATASVDLFNGIYQVQIVVREEFTVDSVTWDLADLTVPESHTFNISAFTIQAVIEFVPSAQLPPMGVLKFLTGLFKLFNLTAFVLDDGTVKVQTLDSFYANPSSSSPFDISSHVDVSKSQVNVALPYREIVFEYKGLKTKLAKQHEQLTTGGVGWGTTEFTGDDKYDGGIYKVEAPFEHLKYERLVDVATGNNTTAQNGWMVDDNDDSYLGDPVLFYPIYQQNQDSIRFLTDRPYLNAASNTDINDYFIPSNSLSLDASISTANLNFNQELNEYDVTGNFTGTLFFNYYSNYINEMFNTKRRLSRFSAYIPLNILLNYTLADRFIINKQSYKINSITTNLKTGLSTLQLLNEVS